MQVRPGGNDRKEHRVHTNHFSHDDTTPVTVTEFKHTYSYRARCLDLFFRSEALVGYFVEIRIYCFVFVPFYLFLFV